MTTLIAALVLFWLGSGPVRGFAVTLTIGILASMFTAVTVTRLMVSYWLRWTRPAAHTDLGNSHMFRGIHFIPPDTKIDFVGLRAITWIVSALLTVVPLILVATVGLNMGIDFQGGTLIEIKTKESPANLADIRGKVNGLGLGEVQIQEFGAPDAVLIRIASQPTEKQQQESIAKVKQALGDTVEYRRVEIVGPTISGELIASGTIAVVVAMIGILIYVWFRFEWQFAVAAIASLIHDVTGTIGLYSLFQLEFNLSSIAAILTIIGYSLNDKVVIFDRIRENLRKYERMPLVRAARPLDQRDAVAHRADPCDDLPRHAAFRLVRRRGDLRLRARHVLGHRHRRLFVDLRRRAVATDPWRAARGVELERGAGQGEGEPRPRVSEPLRQPRRAEPCMRPSEERR